MLYPAISFKCLISFRLNGTRFKRWNIGTELINVSAVVTVVVWTATSSQLATSIVSSVCHVDEEVMLSAAMLQYGS